MLVFGGVPLIYMGDEIGLRNDPSYAEDPERLDDNRWLHRPPMDWLAAERRHDPGTLEGRIFQGIRHLAETRAATQELHAQTPTDPVDVGNDRVLGLRRRGPRGQVLVLANLSPRAAGVHLSDRHTDLVSGRGMEGDEVLAAYEVVWLRPGG